MASKTGMFLRDEERVSLIQELKNKGEIKPGAVPEAILESASKLDSVPAEASFGTGCLTCGEDNDHANLLLCEGCNDEYHTYCLDPPLRAVPTGDWFCANCRAPSFEDDGLDKLISALPPSCTSRFGEVCWAAGGVGFGWWPAFIYDPRLTVGNARQLARKNLGKRHLVYFFECHDAPFACLTDSKITKWNDGLLDDYHLGKTARAAGKARTKMFQQALQAATVEAGKPIEMRMDWNHSDQPQILPSPKPVKPKRRAARKNQKRARDAKEESSEDVLKAESNQRKPRGFEFLPQYPIAQPQLATRRNLTEAIEAVAIANSANQIESSEDGELFCKLLRKTSTSDMKSSKSEVVNIGFVKLKSRKTCTFAEARIVIQNELVPDCIPPEIKWKFFVPSLGPVSSKQEKSLGAMLPFLRSTTTDANLGNGSLLHPLKVIIVEPQHVGSSPKSLNTEIGVEQSEPKRESRGSLCNPSPTQNKSPGWGSYNSSPTQNKSIAFPPQGAAVALQGNGPFPAWAMGPNPSPWGYYGLSPTSYLPQGDPVALQGNGRGQTFPTWTREGKAPSYKPSPTQNKSPGLGDVPADSESQR